MIIYIYFILDWIACEAIRKLFNFPSRFALENVAEGQQPPIYVILRTTVVSYTRTKIDALCSVTANLIL